MARPFSRQTRVSSIAVRRTTLAVPLVRVPCSAPRETAYTIAIIYKLASALQKFPVRREFGRPASISPGNLGHRLGQPRAANVYAIAYCEVSWFAPSLEIVA